MSAAVDELGIAALQQMLTSLGELEPAGSESDAVDRISMPEAIKAGCAAAQAVETMRFEDLRVEAERAAGVPVADISGSHEH